MNIFRVVLEWLSLLKEKIIPDWPLYKESEYKVESVNLLENSVIVIGIDSRTFVIQEEEEGKASLQELNKDLEPISYKVYSNPNSWRFGRSPLEDLAEYLLLKVEMKESLPRIRKQKVDYKT